jgi:hypothetical protein
LKLSLPAVLLALAILTPNAHAQSATFSKAQAAKAARLAVTQQQSATARGTTCTMRGRTKAVCRTFWYGATQTFRGTVTVRRAGTTISPVDTYWIKATGRAKDQDPTYVDVRGRLIVETRRARIGQTLRLFGASAGDVEVTPGAAVDPFASSNPYFAPAAGTRYVAYPVTVRDRGTRRYEGSVASVDLILAGGIKREPSSVPGCDGDVNMAPGEVRQACVVFEVPVGAAIDHLQLTVGEETGVWRP